MYLQTSWSALVQAGNASQILNSSGSSIYTVFAPANSAIQTAVSNSAITCQTDFYKDQQCASLVNLLNSTSLPQMMLNYSKYASCTSLSLVQLAALHLLHAH